MTKQAYIVTDLGFGDAGKGTVVDFLTRQAEPGKTLVVRHNGGPQAGHNVVDIDGAHHEFSQFGAGTLAGAATYLSRFMLINPADMMLEADHLLSLGERVWQRTWVDAEARIITPWHVALNRYQEAARGDNRHGSCGRGVGTLMQQHSDRPDLTIRVRNLNQEYLPDKLHAVRDYCRDRASSERFPEIGEVLDTPVDDVLDLYEYWWQRIQNRIVGRHDWETLVGRADQLIFEGAQGVLLDEYWGFHPHTTWSTTTTRNARALLDRIHWQGSVQSIGVTRAYAVRHGAGPFVTEFKDNDPPPQRHFIEPHNVEGPWQGRFRTGALDLVALRYAIQVAEGIDQLAVTHLDRSELWPYCYGYRMPDGTGTDRIPVGQRGNLKFQAELTQRLEQTEGVTAIAYGDLALIDVIERELEVPVGIVSRGPTAADKRWLSVAKKELA